MVPMDDENTIQNIPYNAMMLNSYGQIILNAADLTLNFSDITFIYNETITGFNITDWNIINGTAYQTDSSEILYPCNSYSNNNCLYDKVNQKDVIFKALLMKEYNCILFMY